MLTKLKELSYFYPTSELAKRHKMPNGGYLVSIKKFREGNHVGSDVIGTFEEQSEADKAMAKIDLPSSIYSIPPGRDVRKKK